MTLDRVLAQLQTLPIDHLQTWAGLALLLLVALAFYIHHRRQKTKRNIGIARLEQSFALKKDPMAPVTPSLSEIRPYPLADDDIETIQKTVLTEKRIDPTQPDEPVDDVLEPLEKVVPASAPTSETTAANEQPLEPPFTVAEPIARPNVPAFPPFEFLKTLPFVLEKA